MNLLGGLEKLLGNIATNVQHPANIAKNLGRLVGLEQKEPVRTRVMPRTQWAAPKRRPTQIPMPASQNEGMHYGPTNTQWVNAPGNSIRRRVSYLNDAINQPYGSFEPIQRPRPLLRPAYDQEILPAMPRPIMTPTAKYDPNGYMEI